MGLVCALPIGWQLIKPAAYDLYEQKVLSHAKLVLVSLLGGRNYWQYGFERLEEWARSHNRTLILVPGDDSVDPELLTASNVDEQAHYKVWRYLRESGIDNSKALLHFLASTFFERDYDHREPQVLPRAQMYMPDSQYNQASLPQWQSVWESDATLLHAAQKNGVEYAPVALLFYRSHLQSANTKMFDQLIEQMRSAGLKPLPIAIALLKRCAIHCAR